MPPGFGMYTRLTGMRLERLGVLLHPVDQLHLGLRGQHDLAVHACRQTTGVALRHPPHADQRVRARAEHQLLQPADPWKVPRLRCREDPLPQPPYVRLRTPPVNLAPALSVVLWSTHHHGRPSRRPACPSVPGSRSSSSPQAHLTASAPLSSPGTRPGIRPVIQRDQLEGPITSRFPAALLVRRWGCQAPVWVTREASWRGVGRGRVRRGRCARGRPALLWSTTLAVRRAGDKMFDGVIPLGGSVAAAQSFEAVHANVSAAAVREPAAAHRCE